MQLKPGARTEGMRMDVMYPVFAAAQDAAAAVGLPWATLTSGVDGAHREGSRHYTGEAADFRRADRQLLADGRVRFADPSQAERQAAVMAEQLGAPRRSATVWSGPLYDVVLEGTHIHVEYDPKGAA